MEPISPIQASKVILHYQKEGWTAYFERKKIYAVTFDGVLLGTIKQHTWVKLDSQSVICVKKDRIRIVIFKKGDIQEKQDKRITKYQKELTVLFELPEIE